MPCTPAEDPYGLNHLRPVAKHLQAGINAWLEGKSSAEAFKPWEIANPERADKVEAGIREKLKAEGATSLLLSGFEVRLYLYKEKKLVYTVGSNVFLSEGEAAFTRIRGSQGAGKLTDLGVPLDKCGPDTSAVVEAARAMAATIRLKKPPQAPFVDPEKWKVIIPPAFQKQTLERLEASKRDTPGLLEAAAATGFDEVRLKMDELWFHARGKDGLIQSGWVRAKLMITETGKMALYFSRFEAAQTGR